MKKIQIFDPAMCCSSGLCGPSIDPELLRMSLVVKNFAKVDYPVERYNLSSEPYEFVNNEKVQALLNDKGPEILPIVLVDGEVVLTGQYPSNEEFEEWTGILAAELVQKPRIRLSTKTTKVGE